MLQLLLARRSGGKLVSLSSWWDVSVYLLFSLSLSGGVEGLGIEIVIALLLLFVHVFMLLLPSSLCLVFVMSIMARAELEKRGP